MDQTPVEPSIAPETKLQGLKKYRHAAYAFLILNIIYLALFMAFLPPFDLGITGYVYFSAYVGVMGLLTWFLFRGARILAMILFGIYALRSVISIYTLITGEAFVAVPYVLPCLILSCYFLGRAIWDWS